MLLKLVRPWDRQPQVPARVSDALSWVGLWTGALQHNLVRPAAHPTFYNTDRRGGRNGRVIRGKTGAGAWYARLISDVSALPTYSCTVLMAGRQLGTNGSGEFGCEGGISASRLGGHVPYDGDGRVYWDFGGYDHTVNRVYATPDLFTSGPDDIWVFTSGARGMEIWHCGRLLVRGAWYPTRVSTGETGWGLGSQQNWSQDNGAAEWNTVGLSAEQASEDWCSRASRSYASMFSTIFAPRRLFIPATTAGGSTSIAAGIGAATAAGHQVAIALHAVVAGGVGDAVGAGHAAGIALRTVVAGGVGEASAQGHAATISAATLIEAGVGAAAATGHQATITIGSGITVTCGTGDAAAQGHQAQISAGTSIGCGIGAAAANGHAVDVALRTVVSGGVAQATAEGLAVGIVLRTTIAAGIGSATAAGHAATITATSSGSSAADVWGYVLSNGKTADQTVTEIHSMLATLLGACPDKLTLIEKLLRNKRITDPVAGTQTVYDNDGSTVLAQGLLFEDAAGTQAYRGQGAERAERLA